MLTAAQKLAASSRIADGDEVLLNRVPLTSAGGRYDDGIPDIDPAELERERSEAQAERFRMIAREEEKLGRKSSNAPAPPAARIDAVDEEYGPDDEDLRSVNSTGELAVVDDGDEDEAEEPVEVAEVAEAVEQPEERPAIEEAADPDPPPAGSVHRVYGRQVRRVRDGHVFESAKAAAGSIGVTDNGIRMAIKRGGPCNGERFEWMPGEERLLRTVTGKPNAMRAPKAIRRVKTGVVYPSQHACCEALALNEKSFSRSIMRSLPYKGEWYVLADQPDPPSTASATRPATTQAKRVVNVKTGEVYASISEASRKNTMGDNAMRYAIAKRVDFHLEGETPRTATAKTAAKASDSHANLRKRYRCVETGVVYESSDAAGGAHGTKGSRIRTCASDGTSYQGYHFEVTDQPLTAMRPVSPPPALVPGASAVAPIVTTPPVPSSDDTTFIAKAMFALAKGGGTADQIDSAIAAARQVAEARRLIAAIEGNGGSIAMRDGRLVAVEVGQ